MNHHMAVLCLDLRISDEEEHHYCDQGKTSHDNNEVSLIQASEQKSSDEVSEDL